MGFRVQPRLQKIVFKGGGYFNSLVSKNSRNTYMPGNFLLAVSDAAQHAQHITRVVFDSLGNALWLRKRARAFGKVFRLRECA